MSEIADDISLDPVRISMEHDVQSSMDTSGYGENRLDYDDADTRCDSSVQFEFPGEIRLQIFLLEEEFRMRRGRRRGWEWVSKEARITKKSWEREQYTDAEWNEMQDSGPFFLGHSDYTD